MNAFFVRWRSARQFREYELYADPTVGAHILEALKVSGGDAIWQAGTLWKCPGCGDRTLRTEEFVEGLRRAETHLREEAEWRRLTGAPATPALRASLDWISGVAAQMFGCERDRVYIKDDDDNCRFARETYISRI